MRVATVAPAHDREIRLLQGRADRSRTGAKWTTVDLAHRRDLGGRARQKHLVRRHELVAREGAHAAGNVAALRETKHRVVREPGQDRGRRVVGDELFALDEKYILPGRLGDGA